MIVKILFYLQGLNSSNDASSALKPLEIVAPRIDTYRFSMANLEETQDADLDAILGELCALDSEYDEEISRVSTSKLYIDIDFIMIYIFINFKQVGICVN